MRWFSASIFKRPETTGPCTFPNHEGNRMSNPPTSQGPRRLNSLVLTLDRHLRMVVVAMMLLVAFGAGMGVNQFAQSTTGVGAQSSNDLADLDEFEVLEETYGIIRDDYVMSDDITDEQLIYGAAAGMVEALGDTGHSRFLNPDEARSFEEQSRGELVGIGIQVDATALPLKVIMPLKDSPAQKAGILSGDVILTIDGTDVSKGEDPQAAMSLLRGEEGTDVELELRHEGEAESYTVTITRARIKTEAVSWAMLPNDILWVRIDGFDQGATDQLEAALKEGKQLGATGLILDLRANPGGLVYEAIGVGSQLQPNDSVLFQQQDSEGETTDVSTVGSSGEWQDMPIVVLIDENSASAAEITSSSLQENGRAILIGQTTAGTGTVLLPTDLSDGSMVLIGTELWLTPEGNVIWHKGVTPDIEVENEPGVQITLPYSYEDNAVTDEQFSTLEDDQLLTAYDEITKEVGGN